LCFLKTEIIGICYKYDFGGIQIALKPNPYNLL
jgi:hypothetical protein